MLSKLFFRVLIIVHFVSCAFYGIGKIQGIYGLKNNWLQQNDLLDIEWT